MRAKPLLLILCALLSILAWQACKEDLVVDNSDKNFPITLNFQRLGEGVQFTWASANLSDFEKYVLVRSVDSIPAGQIPANIFNQAAIIYDPEHRDSTTFTDQAIPIATHLFYKLYVKAGNRFLESANIRIDQDVLTLTGNPTAIKFLPDSSWIFMFDNGFGQMLLIDYKNYRVMSQVTQLPFGINSVNSCEFGVENGKPVMYVASSFGEFDVLNLPDLAVLREMFVSSNTIFSFQPNNNGLIFMHEYDYTNSFTVRRSSDLSIVKNYTRSNYYSFRDILLVDKASNRIVENSYDALSAFNVHPTTGTVSDLISGLSSFNGDQTYDAAKSPDGQYFIPNANGKIYRSSDLSVLGTLENLTGLSAMDYSFTPDGNHIYAVYNGFSSSFIVKYHMPDLGREAELEISNFGPVRIQAIDDNTFVFFGRNGNNSSQLVIKKYDL